MYQMIELEILGTAFSLHGLLLFAGCVCAMVLSALTAKANGLTRSAVWTYSVLAAVLGLMLGRGVYCAVCSDSVFYDAMGDFTGVMPFFDPTIGSANVMGVVAGLLLAAPAAAKQTGVKAGALLDHAVIPGMLLYVFARAIEPLSGQGYGDLMGMEVSVCWIEAVLTLVLLAIVPFLRRKSRKDGTLAQYALVLWCLLQIMPESLRCDEALYVLTFARVTHLGLAVTIGLTLIRLLVLEGKRGLDKKAIALDVLGLAAGIGVCIGTIFALDKTNWPKTLVYGAMLLSLAELGFVILRRIRLADQREG